MGWVLYSPSLPVCWPGSSRKGKSEKPESSRTARINILLASGMSVLVLAGCAAKSPNPAPPARPMLQSLTRNPDGGVCLDGPDSSELIIYIDELERRCL